MYEAEYRLAAGILAPELTSPQRKSLRDYCVRICAERYHGKDEPLLESFFGKRDSHEAYVIAIRKATAEKFRNLHNFLKEPTKGTQFINICLLAWMINFEPRPFRADLKVNLPSAPRPAPEPTTVPSQPPPPSAEGGDDEGDLKVPLIFEKPADKKRWLYLTAAIVSLTVYYFFVHQQRPLGKEGCMVWKGENYEQVPCSYKAANGGIAAIPLDTTVLRRFKKIMKDDTLTANSIGRVFCVKNNGQYEYFTDSAGNPVHPEKPLRRLTQYIMNNNP
jgi:hypothetical protein